MDISEEQLEALKNKIQERERKTRQRVWLLTLVPLAFAALLLGYTAWQISTAETKLSNTEGTLTVKNTQLAEAENKLSHNLTEVPKSQATLRSAQTNLTQVEQDLAAATAQAGQLQNDLATATVQVGQLNSDLNDARIYLAKQCPPLDPDRFKEQSDGTPQSYFLLDLLMLQRNDPPIPWNLTGFSLAEGFDSPNFALFVLQRSPYTQLSSDYQPGTLLWNILTPTTQPQSGDIVYDASGYTMFYFLLPVSQDSTEKMECVIGMTPLGIQILKLDFVPKWSGYLTVPYH